MGQSILFDLVRGKGFDIRKRHLDCGMTIFDQETQDTHAGGSGCGCAAVTLASFVIPKIEKGEWKRVLFVPTGALMSTVSFNEGASVPGLPTGSYWNTARQKYKNTRYKYNRRQNSRRKKQWNISQHLLQEA